MDLSHPEKECFNNNITPKSSRSVSMSSTRLFCYSLLESGPGAVMSKHDWCDAYKIVPVKVADLRLQGFSWLDRYFFELSSCNSKNQKLEQYNVYIITCNLFIISQYLNRNLV